MGFWRDLALTTSRAALGAIAKAAGPEVDEEEDGSPPSERPTGKAAGGKVPGTPVPDGVADAEPGSPPHVLTPAGPAEKVQRNPRTIQELEEALTDPRSLFWDPFAIVDALGYKDKPQGITYQTLHLMSWKMPIIRAMLMTRQRQMTQFAKPQVDKYSTGFRVMLRDRKQRPTPASEAKSQQLERWLLTTGTTDNPAQRDDFAAFLQKVTSDSLMYDQMCWEVVPARSGRPGAFYAVDAATIRIADTTKLFLDPEDQDVVRYVQIYDGMVVAEYTGSELCFGVRNPTTNIRNQQYGQSELEMLVSTITSLLWAWDYNQKFFSQGTSSKGIINIKGTIPEGKMRAFRRHWYSMVSGVENAYRTPIMNADELQWINMQATNRDMEFNAWFDFLIKVASAIYGMDPMEINFKYGDSGNSQSQFESNNGQKLAASKDKGLKPLLQFVGDKINSSLIWPLDEDFMLEFVGLDARTPGEQADLQTKLVKSIKTVNEARAEEDMPPLPNGLGDIILDPVFNQHLQMVAGNLNPPPAPPEPPPGSDDGSGGPPGQEDTGMSGGEGAQPGGDEEPWDPSGRPGQKSQAPGELRKGRSDRVRIDLTL